jgi:hypothetical protein
LNLTSGRLEGFGSLAAIGQAPQRGHFPSRVSVSIIGAAFGALCSLLAGRWLGPSLVRVSLVRFVVAYHAAGSRAQLAVAGHVASDSADDGSLDASFRLHRAGGDERNGGNTDRTQ